MLAFVAFTLTQATAGTRASAFKAEHKRGDNYWNAGAAMDGNKETAWMVPGESNNVGEWIEIDLPQGELDKLGMLPGWAKSKETWADYPRIKKVKIDVYELDDSRNVKQVGTTHAEFEDKMEFQVVDVDDIKIGAGMFGGKVKITVEEIYPGKDFPNFGVSEMLVHLKEMDAVPAITSVSGGEEAKDNLKDQNARTIWSAPATDASVSFEATGWGVSRVGLVPAAGYARPKKVKVSISGREETVELPDTKGTQWVDIPAITGYTGSAWGQITLHFLEVYPGSKPEIGLGELEVKATSYEGI